MREFWVKRKIKAPRSDVWKILGDFSQSPGAGIEVEILTKGVYSNHTGMSRKVRAGKTCLIEKQVSLTDDSFKVEVTRGLMTKSCIWYVTAGVSGGRTVVSWRCVFTPLILGSGFLLERFGKRWVMNYLTALEDRLTVNS